jgi:hypothetical protein
MYSVRTCFSRDVGSANISWLNHIHLFEQEKRIVTEEPFGIGGGIWHLE